MTTHKYDQLAKLLLDMNQAALKAHQEAAQLNLNKTVVWLNDVMHENSRRMNIMLTDIEATTIGSELDAADALRGHEDVVKYNKLGADAWEQASKDRRFAHLAQKRTATFGPPIVFMTSSPDRMPASDNPDRRYLVIDTRKNTVELKTPSLRDGGRQVEHYQELVDEALGKKQANIPAHGGNLFPIPMAEAAPEPEKCKFCGYITADPCETPPADYCTHGSSNTITPPTEGDTK